MKKVIAIILVVTGLWGGTLQAQNKLGYIRVDEMVSYMPELKKIDTLLNVYQQDTLPKTYNYLLANFQRYDSIANDSLHSPMAVRQDAAQKRTDFLAELQNWQNTAQSMIEAKQNALLQPLYDKVLKAIDEVAKEKGYTYIFARESLLVAPPADNLLPQVAEKLKVKLPAPAPATQKPASSSQAKPNN